MKKILGIVLIIAIIIVGYTLTHENTPVVPNENNTATTSTQGTSTPVVPVVSVVVTGLEIPWDIAFLPDGRILVTERPGRLVIIDKAGVKKEITSGIGAHKGEGGLLGVTLHPQFASNHFVYLYSGEPASSGQTQNKVERYTLEHDTLANKTIIIDKIPGALYHDGGRMEFGPDGLLYITTGDATQSELAQDLNSLAGKILRLHDDGKIPGDNPFHTAVYSYGHRNPQGLAWDASGQLWETEHGRSGVLSGYDELNLIKKGGNYGWPTIEGDETTNGMIVPVKNSGAKDTWAPASLIYSNNTLYFGGLFGEGLYEAKLSGQTVTEFKKHFSEEYGRIRTVRKGPDGMLYMTTSNRDGRGKPQTEDDKIIRVNPEALK